MTITKNNILSKRDTCNRIICSFCIQKKDIIRNNSASYAIGSFPPLWISYKIWFVLLWKTWFECHCTFVRFLSIYTGLSCYVKYDIFKTLHLHIVGWAVQYRSTMVHSILEKHYTMCFYPQYIICKHDQENWLWELSDEFFGHLIQLNSMSIIENYSL